MTTEHGKVETPADAEEARLSAREARLEAVRRHALDALVSALYVAIHVCRQTAQRDLGESLSAIYRVARERADYRKDPRRS